MFCLQIFPQRLIQGACYPLDRKRFWHYLGLAATAIAPRPPRPIPFGVWFGNNDFDHEALMARRIRKPKNEAQAQPQSILETPEIVDQKLWSLSDWMEEHWRTVFGVLLGVSVVWGGFGIFQIFSAHRDDKKAEGTAALFEQAALPIVPPQDKKEQEAEQAAGDEEGKDDAKAAKEKADAAAAKKKDELPSFPTERARAEAVVKAFAEAKVDAPAIGPLVGGAKATLGDFQAQLTAVDAALTTAKDSALALPLHIQRATALAGLGKTPEAAAEWAVVEAADTTTFGKALAKERQGDLVNPSLVKAGGSADKAKSAYEAAIKLARVGDKDPPAGALSYLVADVRTKLARL